MAVSIVVGGAVYTHVTDETGVAVVLDLTGIDSEDPKGPDGATTDFRFVLSHVHAVQLGTLILQHAGPFPEGAAQEESN